MRVQGPVVAGGFLDEKISSLLDVEVVGLITWERIVLGQRAKSPHSRECAGFLSPTWKKKVKNRRMNRKMREKMESKE